MEYGRREHKRNVYKLKLALIVMIIFVTACIVYKYLPYFKCFNSELSTEVTLSIPSDHISHIDISAFELDSSGKAVNTNDIVFYNNNSNTEQSIVYLEPGLLGFSSIVIDKNNINEKTDTIVVYCTVYKDMDITFDLIDKLGLKVIDKNTSGLFNFKFDLSDKNAGGTFARDTVIDTEINSRYKALKICSIVRTEDGWKTIENMEYSNNTLKQICESYGLEVQ